MAKILCGKHNSALSDFDAEAARLSNFLATNVLDEPLKEAAISLHGVRLEKWALKTFFNLGFIRALHREQPNRLDPPDHLVRYLFKDEPVADGVGLYFVTGKISNEGYAPGLWWNVIQDPKDLARIYGMAFTFFSVRFVISILPTRAEERISRLGVVNGFDYASAKVIYRPPGIALASSEAGQKRIELAW